MRPSRSEAAKHGDTSLNLASGLSHQFGKGSITLRGIESATPYLVGQGDVAMHADQIKKISTDSRSERIERVTQSVMRALQVAVEPRHCGFLAITPPLQ